MKPVTTSSIMNLPLDLIPCYPTTFLPSPTLQIQLVQAELMTFTLSLGITVLECRCYPSSQMSQKSGQPARHLSVFYHSRIMWILFRKLLSLVPLHFFCHHPNLSCCGLLSALLHSFLMVSLCLL